MGRKIFNEIVVIPIGSDSAPFFASLLLYYYESRWIKDLQKKDLLNSRKLCSVFRFINDLSEINDTGIFERDNFRDLYPLELHRENGNNTEATFLELNILIKNNKFQVGLFDKRDR